MKDNLEINRDFFEKDPFGYSLLGSYKFILSQSNIDAEEVINQPESTSQSLKSPILWMSQAYALSEAAKSTLEKQPDFKSMPLDFKSICDSQYCSVALMLFGLSLELFLKSIKIHKEGIESYTKKEDKNQHHQLHDLAEFIPELDKKEIAILRGLTHFVYWAGKYPDPGSKKESDFENVFQIAEKHHITANDIFMLFKKVIESIKKQLD